MLPAATQGKCEDAELLYERCEAIQKKVLGPEHPGLAATLHNRAEWLHAKVRAEVDIRLSCVDVSTTISGDRLCTLMLVANDY